MASLVSSNKIFQNNNSSQTIRKQKSEHFPTLPMRTVLPQYQNHTKDFTNKENHKAILCEYISKNAQHNTSKLKPAIYKKVLCNITKQELSQKCNSDLTSKHQLIDYVTRIKNNSNRIIPIDAKYV